MSCGTELFFKRILGTNLISVSPSHNIKSGMFQNVLWHYCKLEILDKTDKSAVQYFLQSLRMCFESCVHLINQQNAISIYAGGMLVIFLDVQYCPLLGTK